MRSRDGLASADEFCQRPRVSARAFDCPSCGAAVPFASSIAVSAVCAFCQSIVVVRGAQVETLGVLAKLPPDVTPLQPGTRGAWQGRGFELIGRLRVTWEGGSWNEWCADFSGGPQGWVAEAQGFCMVSFRTEVDDLPDEPAQLHAGQALKMGGRVWSVIDVKEVRCQSGEGQLPFQLTAEWRRLSIDLISRDGAFGSIEVDDEGTSFYSGATMRYPDLALENLRPVPGWSADVEPARNQSATLGCPNCGAAVVLRAAGQTMAAVCGSCGSVIDTANPHLQLIQKADERVKRLNPLLPIGQRGRLFDVEYEVAGFLTRQDGYSKWQEYLLFNPWHGFDWLVNFRGHWNFVRRVLDLGDLSGPKVFYEKRPYSLFAKGKASVAGVLGEFYWKVERGEEAMLHDWVHPPWILSKEEYPGLSEFTWSHGTYLEPAVVASAFALKEMPEPAGIYLNQPNPFAEKWRTLKPWVFCFLGLYVLIQILFALRIAKTPVYAGEFSYERGVEAGKVTTTPTFELKGGSQPVWITADVGLNNSWFGLDVDLVNAETNQTFTVPIAVEYYSGTSGGESWTEGGDTTTEAIAAVPPGTYFLNIETSVDPNISGTSYRVAVKRGGVFWSNFWIGLLALLVFPASVWLRRAGFEGARWSESDFTPVGGASTSDDDE